MVNDKSYDLIVVGGGIVGLASAYRIAIRHPRLKILVLEKENELARHQTGHNSGVIHSGIYYKPGSLKAKNCVKGRHELVAFAGEFGIAHDICGKIIVATAESELAALDRIHQNGIANEVEGATMVNAEEIRRLEPSCEGIRGIHVPCTGIIDFVEVTRKLAELLRSRFGAEVRTGCEALGALQDGSALEIETSQGAYSAPHLICCGGLQSDRIARACGADPGVHIVGFRGDYYELTANAASRIRNLIYPVPDPRFPFLGVHFTRMIHGGVECGPNAVFSFDREGYSKTAFRLADTLDALRYGGTWKFFSRHWRQGWEEYRRAFSKKLFLKSLKRLLPELVLDDLLPGRAGVRAVAVDPDGRLVDDFKIVQQDRMIHVLNAPSPAATSCLAIGAEVERVASASFGW